MHLQNSSVAWDDLMERTSVIIPVRNGSNFLGEAVASALTQIGPADEIIVVWDVSTDNTQTMIERMSDSRVRSIEGPGRGVSAARNIGLAAAEGDLVAFLDHDDLWPQGRHATMMRALRDDLQLDAVFGRMRIKLEPRATPWQWIMDYDGRHVPGPNLGTALFRRNVLSKISGFDETLHFGEDLDYFDRLREAGMRFALCDIDGLIYRRHATNCTNDQRAAQQSVFDVIKRKRARTKSAKSGASR
jgi:glycosyltransferase involved in cell wall biosynthesis